MLRQKATTPVIRTERFRMTTWPHLNTSIAHHCEFNAISVEPGYGFPQLVCRTLRPIEKHVHADQIFSRSRFRARGGYGPRSFSFDGFVFGSLQSPRHLSHAPHHSFGKLPGAHLPAAYAFLVNVVSVNAVFNCTQPRIVHAFGNAHLANVDQHHYGSQQQT